MARAFLLKIPRKTGEKMAAGGGRSIFTKFGEKMNAPPQRLVSFEYHFSLLAVVVVVVANFLSPYLRVCVCVYKWRGWKGKSACVIERVVG